MFESLGLLSHSALTGGVDGARFAPRKTLIGCLRGKDCWVTVYCRVYGLDWWLGSVLYINFTFDRASTVTFVYHRARLMLGFSPPFHLVHVNPRVSVGKRGYTGEFFAPRFWLLRP